jgi:hypothetical protein
MPVKPYPKEIVVQRGQELFDQEIKDQVASLPDTEFVAIDIESGDFETGTDSLETTHRLLARHPDAQIFMRRVGYSYTVRFGGGGSTAQSQPRWRRIPPKV